MQVQVLSPAPKKGVGDPLFGADGDEKMHRVYREAGKSMSTRRVRPCRVQVLSPAPNKNNTNPDGKSEFVLFFTREYFGVKISFD